MSDRDPHRHERLREELRRGDPAGAEAGLSAAETQAMRRAALTALEEPRRLRFFAPAFAAAAAVALSFVVVLALWRAHDGTPVSMAPAPSRPAEPAVPAAPPAILPVAPVAAPPQQPLARRHPIPARTWARRAPVQASQHPSPPDRPVEEIEPEASTPTRQVQFATAGGTRIIWMLPETTHPMSR